MHSKLEYKFKMVNLYLGLKGNIGYSTTQVWLVYLSKFINQRNIFDNRNGRKDQYYGNFSNTKCIRISGSCASITFASHSAWLKPTDRRVIGGSQSSCNSCTIAVTILAVFKDLVVTEPSVVDRVPLTFFFFGPQIGLSRSLKSIITRVGEQKLYY